MKVVEQLHRADMIPGSVRVRTYYAFKVPRPSEPSFRQTRLYTLALPSVSFPTKTHTSGLDQPVVSPLTSLQIPFDLLIQGIFRGHLVAKVVQCRECIHRGTCRTACGFFQTNRPCIAVSVWHVYPVMQTPSVSAVCCLRH